MRPALALTAVAAANLDDNHRDLLTQGAGSIRTVAVCFVWFDDRRGACRGRSRIAFFRHGINGSLTI
jgi:hypothetical protein